MQKWRKNRRKVKMNGQDVLCNACPCGHAWLAGGYNYKIYTSKDGISWSSNNVLLKEVWGIAYNESLWIAIGNRTGSAYCILTSPDGKSWTSRVSPYTSSARGICWGNNLWVVGQYGRITTSPDGINWTVYGYFYSISSVNGIGWNGSLFIAVSSNSGYLTSPDGINWTEREFPFYGGLYWRAVWNGSLWVITGTGYLDSTKFCIITSSDGINWTGRQSPIVTQAYGLAWNGYLFVAGGRCGEIITSPDGINWTERESPFNDGTYNNNSIYDIAWNGSMFVAVGEVVVSGYYEGKIATSPDGINWTEREHLSDRVFCVASAISPNFYPPIGV